jgi:hypothetical protein
MSDMPRDQLIAYLATLATLAVCFLGAIIIAAFNDIILGKMEAFGLGTLVGGLIGVLRLPQQRSVTVDNPPSNPVQTEDAQA